AGGTPANWTYNASGLFFMNDHRYDVAVKATDNAGNFVTVTNRFVYDVNKPTSTIIGPSGLYFTNLNISSGSATDNLGSAFNNPAGLSTSSVQFAVRQVGANWWSGSNSNFNGADPDYNYFTVTNTTTSTPNLWQVTVSAGFKNALVTGTSYRFI